MWFMIKSTPNSFIIHLCQAYIGTTTALIGAIRVLMKATIYLKKAGWHFFTEKLGPMWEHEAAFLHSRASRNKCNPRSIFQETRKEGLWAKVFFLWKARGSLLIQEGQIYTMKTDICVVSGTSYCRRMSEQEGGEYSCGAGFDINLRKFFTISLQLLCHPMFDFIYKFWYIPTNCALLKSKNGKIHKSLWWKKAGRWCVGRQTIGEKGKRGKKMAAVDSKTQKALGIDRYSQPNTIIWRDFIKKLLFHLVFI